MHATTVYEMKNYAIMQFHFLCYSMIQTAFNVLKRWIFDFSTSTMLWYVYRHCGL